MEKRLAHIMGFICLSIALSLSACGGGGGDSAATSPSGISYSGLITPATIDSTNAQNLALGAYQGAAAGGAVGIGVVISETPARPIYLDLSLAMEEFMNQVDLNAANGIVDAGAMVSQSNTITGPNGGNGQYSISVNDFTGDFSGTLSYYGYTTQTTTLTGTCNFTGKVNMMSGSMGQFSLTSDNMAVTSAGKSYNVKMTISLTASSSSQSSLTMEMVLRDNTNGKSYWVNNYNMTSVSSAGYVEVGMSGRYYDPDYGYIDISTPTTIKISTGANYPYDGILLATGKSGTKAKLTALSATTYKVEADTNGDGTYEWNSGTKNW